MMSFPSEVENLSDSAAIAALRRATERYVRGRVTDVAQFSAVINTFIEMQDPGAAAITQDQKAAAQVARAALAVMLQSGPYDHRAARLVAEAIEEQRHTEGQAEPVTLLIVGGYFLALAVVAKVSYGHGEGWAVEPGFPGLAEVLDKAGKLVSAIMPGAKPAGS